jgi:hypothetical protein
MVKQYTFPVNLRRLHSYAKLKLGYASKKNASIYQLVCKALYVDNKPKPKSVSAKQWVLANAQYLNSFVVPSRKNESTRPVAAFESSKDFLSTYEWRKVRMLALKKYGARCQCCGATPASGAIMNVDHIKPRKLFPELALEVNNLQILCHECNHGKGNWDMTDWRPDQEYQDSIQNFVIQLPNI